MVHDHQPTTHVYVSCQREYPGWGCTGFRDLGCSTRFFRLAVEFYTILDDFVIFEPFVHSCPLSVVASSEIASPPALMGQPFPVFSARQNVSDPKQIKVWFQTLSDFPLLL